MEKYVSQWYWGTDWLGNKCKNWYHGPRIDWMYLDKDELITRKKERKGTNRTAKKVSQRSV